MQDTGHVHAPDRGHGALARAGGGDAFHDLLVAALPRLRVHALSLTRNRAEADDLVQDAATLALRNRGSFELGTNFEAWMYCILRNRFISLLRQRRGHADIDAVPQAALDGAGPAHEQRIVLKELARLVARLSPPLREALVLVAVQGMTYEQVAAVQGCAVGTAKSRVFRARQQLQAWLLGEALPPARATLPAPPAEAPSTGVATP
jgi:RNA polymerase sigma-70 factor, ECF subfamily